MSWPLIELSEIAPAKPFKNDKISEKDHVLQLTLDHIESNSGHLLKRLRAPVRDAGSSTHWFTNKHVLYSKLRPYLNKVYLPEETGIGTTELVPLLPDEKRLDRKYLAYYLRSKTFVDWVSSQTAGAKMPRVSMKVFWEHQIPLPPLAEQKRIAAILDKADAIRRKRQQAIQLADDFLRATFLDMFGDPAINPNSFPEFSLGELKSSKMNNGVFRKNDEYDGKTPVAWVSELFRGREITFNEKGNFIDPTDNEIKKYGLQYGDILFCRSSLKLEGIGFNNVYLGQPDDALFECHLIRMSPDLNKVEPIFLNYQLRFPNIRKRVFQQSKTVTMTTIDQDGLSKVIVCCPPKPLQEKFASIERKVSNNISKLESEISVVQDLFSSLSQKAFSGQL